MRITKYEIDDNVQAGDKWIGTDIDGLYTKNFTSDGIVSYVAERLGYIVVPLHPLQKIVTASTYKMLPEDHKYNTIFFENPTGCTVTVDNDLPQYFEVGFYNLGAGDVVFTGGTATLGYPDGDTLVQDRVCTLIKVLDENRYRVKGELE